MNLITLTLEIDFINRHVGTINQMIANSIKTIEFLNELKDSTQSKAKHIVHAMDIIKKTKELNQELIQENKYFSSKLKGISHE